MSSCAKQSSPKAKGGAGVSFVRRRRIRSAFGAAAAGYDALAGLQRRVGSGLLSRLPAGEAGRVLDIGMGTGDLTAQLCRCFPAAAVVGMDFSDGMVEAARRRGQFTVVQADALNLPFSSTTFAIIVANLVYQWVDDPVRAFSEVRRVLTAGGCFGLTVFGEATLTELFSSVENALISTGRHQALPLRRLNSGEQVRAALEQAGLQVAAARRDTLVQVFDDAPAVLRWLKGIGANALNRDVFIGRDILRRAGEYYRQNFACPGGVRATFEVWEFQVRKGR